MMILDKTTMERANRKLLEGQIVCRKLRWSFSWGHVIPGDQMQLPDARCWSAGAETSVLVSRPLFDVPELSCHLIAHRRLVT
jgi:hypothetical protein